MNILTLCPKHAARCFRDFTQQAGGYAAAGNGALFCVLVTMRQMAEALAEAEAQLHAARQGALGGNMRN